MQADPTRDETLPSVPAPMASLHIQRGIAVPTTAIPPAISSRWSYAITRCTS